MLNIFRDGSWRQIDSNRCTKSDFPNLDDPWLILAALHAVLSTWCNPPLIQQGLCSHESERAGASEAAVAQVATTIQVSKR